MYENNMGKLIIDENSVFEIDEDCVKEKKVPKECDIDKYLSKNTTTTKENYSQKAIKKQR